MSEENKQTQAETKDESKMDVDPSDLKEAPISTAERTPAAATAGEEQSMDEGGNKDVNSSNVLASSTDTTKEQVQVAPAAYTTETSTERPDAPVLTTEAPNTGAEGKRAPSSPPESPAPSKKSKVETAPLPADTNNAITSPPETSSNTPQPPSIQNEPEKKDTATLPSGVSTSNQITTSYENIEPSIAKLIQHKLEPIAEVTPLKPLSLRDLAELENALQLGDKYDFSEDDGWKKDWSGSLQLFEKEVVVNQGYVTSQPNAKPIKVHFHESVIKSAENECLRGLELLFSYVYHMKGCPEMAQKILAHSLRKSASSLQQRLEYIIDAIRRTTFDPIVLQQDGWITKKAESPEGSMGGASLIGRHVIWQRHEALIIAFTPDETWGSLWKAIWTEDLETFDMEADEVKEALSKYEKKQARLQKKAASTNVVAGSTRNQATARFLVEGIGHGIVLALPSRGSKGAHWPARVLHVSEIKGYSGGRRNSYPTKSQVQVVFLAPFWNGDASSASRASAKDPFSLGPYFELDTIEISDLTLKKYPFNSFSVEDIKSSFQFLGLPNAVLSRYLDANRLAMALKTYAMKYIPTNYSPGDTDAFSSMTESHAMSVLAPIFPNEVLDLPYDFILSQLPRANEHTSVLLDSDDAAAETVIDIKSIIDSMTPPSCFGKKDITQGIGPTISPERGRTAKMIMSPNPNFTPMSQDSENGEGGDLLWSMNNFASDLLIELFDNTTQSSGHHPLSNLPNLLNSLLMQMRELVNEFKDFDHEKRKEELSRILRQCLLVKGHGEEMISCSPVPRNYSATTITTEWRRACERLYRRAVSKLKIKGGGNGHSTVITDSRCNGHITAENAFERPVRLPAAIKGAKQAGAGSNPNLSLINSVEDAYVVLAEEKVIPKAHQRSYIKRLKSTIASIPPDKTGVQLTDDSEGEGGDDTKGSRGSYNAATVGVAAALMAVDMVVGGQCVNSFCAVRPPGHHAGRELRPMKAVSNGFCLFNAAACAAIYAATPQSQGGLGLRRVCVIDFDLHHGNGTQDILCSTHDSRFLYVSMHAGGAHINGYEEEDGLDEAFHLPGSSKTTEGIFPGRCGDSNPHHGVLNIPLGSKVMPNDVGTALVSQVLPKVEEFSPDLIILSAGFDAHVNDPLGMGGLSAADFGHITEVVCRLAFKICSGRILSVLEGGYGVPCCQPRTDLFLPKDEAEKLLDLGVDLPNNMPDPVTSALMRQKLNKCHAEGFIECVKQHVESFVKFNKREDVGR